MIIPTLKPTDPLYISQWHLAMIGKLGFAGVNDVRAGRVIELDVADGTSDATLDDMCRKLLANMVIENFEIEQKG